jgi:flagellar motility protein MotE (MotC chaperone)
MKALMFLLPVIIAGTVLGLAFTGTINIPGISPKKKAAVKAPVKVAEKPKVEVKKEKKKEDTLAPAGDPVKGFEAVAKLWNEMEVDKLKELTAKWKDDDLAPILRKMEPDKTVEFLAAIDAERASVLTKKIQELAELEAS